MVDHVMGAVACCLEPFESDIPSPTTTEQEREEEDRKNALKYNLYKLGAVGYQENFVGNPPIASSSDNNSDFSKPDLFKYSTPSSKELSDPLIPTI